jgi:Fe-S cluster assembly protein SufD
MSAALESLIALRTDALTRFRSGEADWIGRLRDEALAAFCEQGFPTRRLENWKGTNLSSLEAICFENIGASEPNPVVVIGDGIPELRFVDGRLDTANSQAASLPNGVRLLSFAEARRQAPELLEGRLAQLANPKRQAMVALQTAFLDDGAVLAIDAGVELETPIRLSFATSEDAASAATAAFPRLLVIAGERSRAQICLDHGCRTPGASEQPSDQDSRARGLTAFVAELYLAAEARLESVEIQNEAAERIHFTSMHARLERSARFDSHVFTLGTGLVRSELEVKLAESGGETNMRGFYLGRAHSHVDHFTTVDHEAESCTSDQEYRGVLGDESNGVFRGRVIVRPGAQQTDARQSNPNLLVSDRAGIDSKPQLEIYADDVKASHGSTIGQLDPDALFFLRARGIDAAESRLLLTRAFAQNIVDGISDSRLRATVSNRVEEALASLESEDLRISSGTPAPEGASA